MIKEINDLRRELKMSRSKIHDYEAQLGIANKKNAAAGGSNLPDVARDAGMKRSSSAMLTGATLTDEQGQRIIEMQVTHFSTPNMVTNIGTKTAPSE